MSLTHAALREALPEYDERRTILAQCPLAAADGFHVLCEVALEMLFGQCRDPMPGVNARIQCWESMLGVSQCRVYPMPGVNAGSQCRVSNAGSQCRDPMPGVNAGS